VQSGSRGFVAGESFDLQSTLIFSAYLGGMSADEFGWLLATAIALVITVIVIAIRLRLRR
jgi:hypothetical protein